MGSVLFCTWCPWGLNSESGVNCAHTNKTSQKRTYPCTVRQPQKRGFVSSRAQFLTVCGPCKFAPTPIKILEWNGSERASSMPFICMPRGTRVGSAGPVSKRARSSLQGCESTGMRH